MHKKGIDALSEVPVLENFCKRIVLSRNVNPEGLQKKNPQLINGKTSRFHLKESAKVGKEKFREKVILDAMVKGANVLKR
jgi:hypothetical protein